MGTPTTPTQQHEDELLDEALEESFPASDVPHPAVKTATKPAEPSPATKKMAQTAKRPPSS
jgi:hypothetical protein